MEINDYFLTQSQTAELLNTTRQTISRWIREGKLNSQRIGRVVFISKVDIKNMLKERIEQEKENLENDEQIYFELSISNKG